MLGSGLRYRGAHSSNAERLRSCVFNLLNFLGQKYNQGNEAALCGIMNSAQSEYDVTQIGKA